MSFNGSFESWHGADYVFRLELIMSASYVGRILIIFLCFSTNFSMPNAKTTWFYFLKMYVCEVLEFIRLMHEYRLARHFLQNI